MPLKLTMAEARRRLTRLPAELRRGARSDVAIITDSSEPVLAILPWEMYDGLLETLEILGDHEQMVALSQGIQDITEGRTQSWDAVKLSLPLS
jgi:PHD/YefM family antitoxin component YafN of YafNO toxin-antitoxin module